MTEPQSTDILKNQELDRLLAAYRESTLDWSATSTSPNFMPLVWQRIESRRTGALGMTRFARIFASAAAALAIIAGLYVSRAPVAAPGDDTWVETVANSKMAQVNLYYEPLEVSNISDNPPLHD